MCYLVLKEKGMDDFLYTQSKVHRDRINEILVEMGEDIETIVIKTFNTKEEADKYCLDINSVTGILNHLF